MITRSLYREDYDEMLNNLRVGMRVFTYNTHMKGTIVKILLEEKGEDRHDSFIIEWDEIDERDGKSKSSWPFVLWIDEDWKVEEIVEE